MELFASLNREQKESIGLLQIGTFLEYFDLMLYVHMAVLLNELFFPKADLYTASLLAAFAFCSTFVFRPIGAMAFGWIGDHIGRKVTIILTTAIMALSCLVMANLPTYAQIGITAAWIVTICRVLQGMSSMGESVSAEIYLVETVQRPARFPVVAFIGVSATLGGFAALATANLIIFYGLSWRVAFWAGAIIAIISAVARTRLRETPVFLEMKRKWLKKQVHEMNLETDAILGTDEGARINATWKEPVNYKTLISYFFISCGTPLCFFLAFFYFNPILKDNFGYSPEDIIKHNFLLSLISLSASIVVSSLSYRIHPLIISKVRGFLTLFLMILIPFLMAHITSPVQLLIIQGMILLLPLDDMPSSAIFLSHFPIYRRVTFASLLFAFSRALIYIITSFGLIYLGTWFGLFGIYFISLPVTISFLFGIFHFEQLERKHNLYPGLS